MVRKIGFLVNPIAGMGGRVGLKGTDGRTHEAIARGAAPTSPARAGVALALLQGRGLHFLTCSGKMGEEVMVSSVISEYSVVYRFAGESSAADTIAACHAFVREGAEVVLFCGGDGTARDVVSAIENRVPVLGIPGGVKMFSGVFATTPAAASSVLLSHDLLQRDAEVLDVDEDAYRRGEWKTRLYAIATTLSSPGLVPAGKRVFVDVDEARARASIARFLTAVMREDTTYILGPGSTTAAIAEEMGLKKTLLGFDAVKGGVFIGNDLNEGGLLEILSGEEKVRLVISPLGSLGAVFGRGTQQVSPAVLKKIGVSRVILVATPHKLAETPVLFVDTGDPALDAQFGEYVTVISGDAIAQRARILRPIIPI